MTDKREINEVIVHCSATPPDMDVDAATIRRWHVEENHWSDIGYHFVILRDGTSQAGRPVHVPGAHCRGHNAHSIGICLIGGVDRENKPEFNFTAAQARTLRALIQGIQSGLPHDLKISGHRDHDKHKACPCFDANQWWWTGRWEG